jgi:hypothetical protein
VVVLVHDPPAWIGYLVIGIGDLELGTGTLDYHCRFWGIMKVAVEFRIRKQLPWVRNLRMEVVTWLQDGTITEMPQNPYIDPRSYPKASSVPR